MTKIEWAERTWNPLVGCTVCSAGCAHCYAMRDAWRKQFNPNPKISTKYAGTVEKTAAGQLLWTGRVNFDEAALLAPLKRRKPTDWFVNSMSDLFHPAVTDEEIDRVFAVMALTPQHTYKILTKRADRMREYITSRWGDHAAEVERTTRAVNSVFRLDFRLNWGRCGSTSTAITTIGWGTGAREPGMLRRLPDGGVERLWYVDGQEKWYRCADSYAARVPVWGAHTSEFGWGLKMWPLPNVWLGVSVEDQTRADERIPDLLATPAALRFLSCEPLLGPVDLTDLTIRVRPCEQPCGLAGVDALTGVHWDAEDTITGIYGNPDPRIDWVIAGGESGPGARPMHPDWARSLRDQCAAAGVAFLFKQWGEWVGGHYDGEKLGAHVVFPDWGKTPAHDWGNNIFSARIGKARAGRMLDGRTHDALPAIGGVA